MDNPAQIHRISALSGHCAPGKSGLLGADGTAGVVLKNIEETVLWQVAGWPDSMDSVAVAVAKAAGVASAPGSCKAATGKKGSLLRIDPLKWWLFGAMPPQLKPDTGATLDISHSRTHIQVTGVKAVDFLNRFLPLDLREDAFPAGAVDSSFIHHVGVTLWRSGDGYELFIPRGFALMLWEGFVEVAAQFGLEIV